TGTSRTAGFAPNCSGLKIPIKKWGQAVYQAAAKSTRKSTVNTENNSQNKLKSSPILNQNRRRSIFCCLLRPENSYQKVPVSSVLRSCKNSDKRYDAYRK